MYRMSVQPVSDGARMPVWEQEGKVSSDEGSHAGAQPSTQGAGRKKKAKKQQKTALMHVHDTPHFGEHYGNTAFDKQQSGMFSTSV